MSWSFFIGLIVGGIIIYYFWRSKVQEAIKTEQMLRRQLTDTESETRRLTAELDGLKRPEALVAPGQAELQQKTNELQQITAQFSAAEAQIQTLRDQLDAAEAKAAMRRKQFATAKARMRNLNDELATPATKPEAVIEQPLPVIAAAGGASEQRDDLMKIEGIGPKVSQALNESGILTFAQLAQTEVSRLRTILQDAGPRFRMIEPESWPEQAGLAASGNWEALSKLQDELDGGKYRR